MLAGSLADAISNGEPIGELDSLATYLKHAADEQFLVTRSTDALSTLFDRRGLARCAQNVSLPCSTFAGRARKWRGWAPDTAMRALTRRQRRPADRGRRRGGVVLGYRTGPRGYPRYRDRRSERPQTPLMAGTSTTGICG